MSKDFLELAQERYSVRKFSDKPVEKEKIDLILRAGQLAPTAHNSQPQRIICVNSAESLELLRKCTSSHYDCTAAMIVCHDKDTAWVRPFDGKSSGDIDAAIVTSSMMFEAQNLGIGTTWVMYFNPEAVRKEFQLPDNIESTAILVMGYPAVDAQPSGNHSNRLPLEETVSFNHLK